MTSESDEVRTLREIEKIIFGPPGAPVGSDNYFAIRILIRKVLDPLDRRQKAEDE